MPSKLVTRLESRSTLIGTFVTVNSPDLAEALSLSGLDWLFFDMEHAAISAADVQHMIQAVRPPCLSLVRIAEALPNDVKKALDTGCDGIIVPQVNCAATAKRVVDAGKYAPLGNRGLGLSRSSAFGAALTESFRSHNEEKAIIVQIEHTDAVQNLDEILNVPGVDGVFVGPYDLSSSMGLIGDVQHPQVQAAISHVVAAAAKRGMPAGIFIAGDEKLPNEIKRGFQFIAVGSDLLRLVASARATVAARDQN